jgi:hypothetical protein
MSNNEKEMLYGKIQYFADLLLADIVEIENRIMLTELTPQDKLKLSIKLDVIKLLLERFEHIFEEFLFLEDDI